MITLTLLTRTDCTWCNDGKQLLAGLSREFGLHVDAVDLDSNHGRVLAAELSLLCAPGLIADGKLIAHGRLSARALRRDLNRLLPTPDR